MKFTSQQIAEIKQKMEDYRWDYEYVGLRVQEVEFQLGKMDHVSKVWIDGHETEEELSGVCATMADDITANDYFGEHAAIIAGYSMEYGVDIGEIIIADPVVVDIIA